jgi:chromosome segregation and condensation protein ScpB
MNTAEAKRVLETALCASEPLTVNSMKKLFQETDDQGDVVGADTIKSMLEDLRLCRIKALSWCRCRMAGGFRVVLKCAHISIG